MSIRITHPRPVAGRQTAFQVDFVDGWAEVESLHPERELALTQHGFIVAEVIEGTPLEALTKQELRDIAKDAGIELPAKATKPEIIAAINASPNIPVLE
jgi:hypothetical protein